MLECRAKYVFPWFFFQYCLVIKRNGGNTDSIFFFFLRDKYRFYLNLLPYSTNNIIELDTQITFKIHNIRYTNHFKYKKFVLLPIAQMSIYHR